MARSAVTAGTGLTGGGAVALGNSVTLTSSLGTTIEGSEVTNGTLEAIDLESTNVAGCWYSTAMSSPDNTTGVLQQVNKPVLVDLAM
ncbi:MAG: hypothetical protein R3B12_01065 [Candidatus Saccharimonadales bacterium]